MRPQPAQAVLDWIAAHGSTALFFSAIGEAELRIGAAILPAGRRRDSLTAVIDTMIAEDFADRVLSFNSAAAKAYAAIAATCRAAGRPIAEADCRIAAIARVQGAVVATRNVGDFEGCGIDVVDPWQAWGSGGPNEAR
jgi:toxin FitB